MIKIIFRINLENPYIWNFLKIVSLLPLLIVHFTFELVNWNPTIQKLFKIFLIILWYFRLLEFDFRILFEWFIFIFSN